MTVDYKSTVYLPKTDFPMKANLPKLEPSILQHWADNNIEGKIQKINQECPKTEFYPDK